MNDYIEMCIKAEKKLESYEIRFKHSLIPNLYYNVLYETECLLSQIDEGVIGHNVWLPRQDQLQKIYNADLPFIPSAVTDAAVFFDWIFNQGNLFMAVETMEQLWLRFLMYNKFSQEWNNDTKTWDKVEVDFIYNPDQDEQ